MTAFISTPTKLVDPFDGINLRKGGGFKVYFPILLSGDLVQSPEHLGPAYLASVLRKCGAEVRLKTVEGSSDFVGIMADIQKFQPDLIGLSLTTVALEDARRFGLELSRAVSEQEGVFIVGGGPLATHLGGDLLKLDGWEFLDAIVRGEGEVPIVKLAYALQVEKSLSDVESLAWRSDKGIESNPLAPGIFDLNSLPAPARDQVEEYGGTFPYLRLSTSRGCTSHCTFCNAPHAKNRVGPRIKAWRGVKPETAVDEIEALIDQYGVNTFDFVDSTFEDPGGGAFGKRRIAQIADIILDRGLNIYFNVCMQAKNWSDEDKPLINKLWRAGLEKVLVGIESGSDRGLDIWQKKSSVADNERILGLLRESNIFVAFGFIAFHPWMTFVEYQENTEFLRHNAGHNLRRFITRLELYPGSEVIEHLSRDGLLDEEYFRTLNIYAYKYEDPKIEALASSMNLLFGVDYASKGVIYQEPAVFAYETSDIIIHNFSSRLRRSLQNCAVGLEIMDDFDRRIDAQRDRLASFNADLIADLAQRAQIDQLKENYVLERGVLVEQQFAEIIRKQEQDKMATGLRLRREGIDVRSIMDARNLKQMVS